jgi:DNA-binding response OmpR family regulator
MNKVPPTILVVDDETTVREVVRKYLEHDGYRVIEAETGGQALAYLRDHRPDLIVLDLMLPEIDGFSITRSVRDSEGSGVLSVDHDIPIIILTARTSELDRIAGFELGADDYVVKPFSPRELSARVRAVLRRSSVTNTEDEKPITAGSLMIDPRSREVRMGERMIVLTAKEFDLLYFLARHPRQVFTRSQLLDQLWGYEFYGDESTVTVHIRRLREKIEANPSQPAIIQTVWGVGYKFETP